MVKTEGAWLTVGAAVGEFGAEVVGCEVGCSVGRRVGLGVGNRVGPLVGWKVGAAVGGNVGGSVGEIGDFVKSSGVGELVVGDTVGGLVVGDTVGVKVGAGVKPHTQVPLQIRSTSSVSSQTSLMNKPSLPRNHSQFTCSPATVKMVLSSSGRQSDPDVGGMTGSATATGGGLGAEVTKSLKSTESSNSSPRVPPPPSFWLEATTEATTTMRAITTKHALIMITRDTGMPQSFEGSSSSSGDGPPLPFFSNLEGGGFPSKNVALVCFVVDLSGEEPSVGIVLMG